MLRCHHECLSVGFVENTIHRNVEYTRASNTGVKSQTNLQSNGELNDEAKTLNANETNWEDDELPRRHWSTLCQSLFSLR
jgi:hypothetical protein